jgi:ABC-type Na+ efflux pump permease subunit
MTTPNMPSRNEWLVRAIVYALFDIFMAISLSYLIPLCNRRGEDTSLLSDLRLGSSILLSALAIAAFSMYVGLTPLFGLVFLVIAFCSLLWLILRAVLWVYHGGRNRRVS